MSATVQRVLVVVGSRPEAIKLAPVVFALRAHEAAQDGTLETQLCATGQQRDLLPQALHEFGLCPQHDLNVMEPDQSLAGLTARLLTGLDRVLTEFRPDWAIVQGDTTSAMAGALAAFYRRVKVGHVEAGMRTGDRWAPFPEEVNRRLIASCAVAHFAATESCRRNLLAEGIPPTSIVVTGNTVIDALLWMRDRNRTDPPAIPAAIREAARAQRPILLVTIHRREHFGADLEQVCLALQRIVRAVPDVQIVFPVHPNPHVRVPVQRLLQGEGAISLIDPIPYRHFVGLLDLATLVLTDSGGVQEEAPTFGKPVLVLRRATERTEGIDAGTARLVGTHTAAIVDAVVELLTDRATYASMSRPANPYGDGRAAERIVAQLLRERDA